LEEEDDVSSKEDCDCSFSPSIISIDLTMSLGGDEDTAGSSVIEVVIDSDGNGDFRSAFLLF
jgi:hypothetical protein